MSAAKMHPTVLIVFYALNPINEVNGYRRVYVKSFPNIVIKQKIDKTAPKVFKNNVSP